MKKWKIDENKELPLAIIEDSEEGLGVAEIGNGEYNQHNLKIAEEIVTSHNARVAIAPEWLELLVHVISCIKCSCALECDTITIKLCNDALRLVRD
jgi:hypothetical protein